MQSSFTPRPRISSQDAFGRLESLGVLAAVALLALVVLPALANTKPRSQRAHCANNLSRVGRAFNEWAATHGDRYPMQVTYSDGGLMDHPSGLQLNSWLQFGVLSNEVATPRVFACPSDSAKRTAVEFSLSSNGGFLHPNYQNGAVSYLVSHPFAELGRTVLAGDRNLTGSDGITSCSYFGFATFFGQSTSRAGWSRSIHVETGNLLFNDGSVEQTDAAGLRRALNRPLLDASAFHFISP